MRTSVLNIYTIRDIVRSLEHNAQLKYDVLSLTTIGKVPFENQYFIFSNEEFICLHNYDVKNVSLTLNRKTKLH